VADLTLHAKGAALPELFEDVAAQLLSHLTEPAEIGSAHREKLVVVAPTPEELLRAWVDQLLALPRIQKVIYHHCVNGTLRDSPLGLEWRCDMVGELLDPARHRLREDLAAGRCAAATLSDPPVEATLHIAYPGGA
jgi:SHS2 domain-containing protein